MNKKETESVEQKQKWSFFFHFSSINWEIQKTSYQ